MMNLRVESYFIVSEASGETEVKITAGLRIFFKIPGNHFFELTLSRFIL